MNNIDKNINLEIEKALKESYEYIEMYNLKIQHYKNSLLKLEKTNKEKYKSDKEKIVENIKKYESYKAEEEKLIELMKKAWKKSGEC